MESLMKSGVTQNKLTAALRSLDKLNKKGEGGVREEMLSADIEEDKWDPKLKAKDLTDPWGRPFEYQCPGQHGKFDLYSLGADGQEGRTGQRPQQDLDAIGQGEHQGLGLGADARGGEEQHESALQRPQPGQRRDQPGPDEDDRRDGDRVQHEVGQVQVGDVHAVHGEIARIVRRDHVEIRVCFQGIAKPPGSFLYQPRLSRPEL
jgi:hypothetical protein